MLAQRFSKSTSTAPTPTGRELLPYHRPSVKHPEDAMPEQARVLIVEDNEPDRALLEAHRTEDGFRTDLAADGIAGWPMLDATPARYALVPPDRTRPLM